jgi:steroid delta-isomerase-like uncharacterized protein
MEVYMSVEKNKAAVHRRVEELWNKGNLSVADELVTHDWVMYEPNGIEIRGPEGFKQLVTVIRTALPDLHFTIDDMVGEGDIVVYRFTMRGTFKGPLMGIAPTGKQINFKEAHFIRFSDGKEVEALAFGDMLTWYQQLGIPVPTG